MAQQRLAEVNLQVDQLLNQMGQDGLLDEQFAQLMQLQDEGNPDFVKEVVELYFQDSASKLDKLEAKLAEGTTDYNEVDQLVHQFKGSSASFGAQQIAALCVQLREACQQRDRDGCRTLLARCKDNFSSLKSRLDVFMRLEEQRKQLQALC